LWSPVPARLHDTSVDQLYPLDVSAPPPQLPPLPAANAVRATVAEPPSRWMLPVVVAVLLRSVTCVTVAVPLRQTIAPPVSATLLLNVELRIVAVAALSRPPPSASAVFPVSVSAVRSRLPVTLAMPPPLLAAFPLIVTRAMLAVPPFQRPPPVVAFPTVPKFPEISPRDGADVMVNVAPAALWMPPPVCPASLVRNCTCPTVAVPPALKSPPPRTAPLSDTSTSSMENEAAL